MDNLLEIEIVILWGLKNGKTIKEIAKYTGLKPSVIEEVKTRYYDN